MAIESKRRLLPRWTLRLRLTLLYGGLFLAAGAVLLAITYGLVAHSIDAANPKSVFISGVPGGKQPALPQPPPDVLKASGVVVTAPGPQARPSAVGGQPQQVGPLAVYAGKVNETFRQLTRSQARVIQAVQADANAAIKRQRGTQLNSLLTESGVGLAIMAFVSIGLGWLMAGRALRPLRTMGTRARGISERNLHERLALAGPDDELKELGDTFDALLARLESAFESQRRFVANASHELRTPITLSRTLVEVALADPRPSVASLRDTCERVLAADEQQERLIEALLTLARSQRGLDAREELDLGAIAGEVVQAATPNGVRLEPHLGDARAMGDAALLERLVANLVDNGLKYNEEHGWLSVWTGLEDGAPTLRVVNTGPIIQADQVGALAEPFRRLNGERPSRAAGLGLGLSIVRAIATAHGAELRTTPRTGGGLEVVVSFPAR